jgi:lipid II:glycine glycyltransferase (peptidoglycan interpeptide bridge formation enzyme)
MRPRERKALHRTYTDPGEHSEKDVRVSIITERAVWQEFVARHPAGHLLQTWDWGELKARFGWHAIRIALTDETGSPSAGAQVLLHPLPVPGGRALAYVPKGPLVDWHDPIQAGRLLDAIHPLCRAQRCIFLKIEPPAEDDAALCAAIAQYGFRPYAPTVQPPRTILIDLSFSEEAILARMKQKTRYNIRLAARKGVRVYEGHADHVAVFYQLLEDTSRRDHFAIHHFDYYRTAYELFAPHHAALLLAEVAGEVVAGLMVFTYGRTAYYLFGASNDRHREHMPTYLLQWEAMRWARARGCTAYDLWGIPDAEEETLESHLAHADRRTGELWGVYRFKRGFGGQVVRSVGAFDYVYNPLLYRLYRWWQVLRRRAYTG